MSPEFEMVFDRLRSLLRGHSAALQVTDDTDTRFCVAGKVGPATLKAWGGKRKADTIPVAWVQVGKAYVGYHHIAFGGSAALRAAMSKELRARMQGKTCFNFTVVDEVLFKELDALSARANRGVIEAGFVV
jgi:hypothetical protein